ncbi:ENHANCER OF AG-4 protein 2-like [Hibiscus syriacus]|uniref:ENHANCER OF AG-4 protein 2-like n=1 Tax=Hibiscus syriacus TaxID=106335 RepID=UPI0019217601|nr:ENHANCER OF AG-4 protein 2-like [Hibiscus syriacus]XP_039055443.1 ENHANCER OF AG-4 protein 2-like [Hibiscus syriacus]
MAGSRKKGGNKAKVKNFSLGDLVLAKVKGFPTWPAKISRPEDWEREPDPKKYFVQFFGTEEIAFVAPADIQVFTSETKSKLSAKCQVVKTRYFVQAVKEICKAFDELHKEKSSDLRDESDRPAPGCEASSADGVEEDAAEVDLKDGAGALAHGEETADLGKGESNSEYKKPLISSHLDDSSSPLMFSEGKDKLSSGEQAKKEVLSPASLDEPARMKEEFSDDKIVTVNRTKKTLRNDHMSKKMAPGLKKRTEQGHKGSSSAATLLRDDKSGCCLDRPDSEEKLKDRIKGKVSDGSVRKFSPDAFKSDSNQTGGKKAKELVKSKSNLKATDDVKNPVSNPKGETTGKKKRGESGLGKPKSGAGEVLRPAKKPKVLDMKNEASKGSLVKEVKTSPSSNNVNDKAAIQSESKKCTSHVLALRAPTSVISDVSGDEAVLPLLKRHRRSLEAMDDSSNSDNKIGKNPAELKNSTSSSGNLKIPASQLPRRSRAVCLFDDDDEDPKTPLHGGSVRDVKVNSVVSAASKSIDVNHSITTDAQFSVGDSNQDEDNGPKEASSQLVNDFVSPIQPQTVERRPSTHASATPEKSESEELSSKGARSVLISPRKSPHLVSATKQVEQHKPTKAAVKVSSNGTQKKAPPASVKGSGVTTDGSRSSQNQVLSQRYRQASSVERLKPTPKAVLHVNGTTFLTETSVEFDIFKEDRNDSLIDAKNPDSATSMKHLIAAAQAKRKQAHSQQYSLGNPSSVFLSMSEVHGVSSSPSFQPFPSAINNEVQADVQEFVHRTIIVSPPTLGRQSGSQNQQDTEEVEERRASSGHIAAGGSLSGGTEASIARDAFEGMIETLSRTKESIGRATRLAIDCAKYGIANEVVELLIRKLESEPSFHRKVDLFFLVDSITQCSHNQKGIAGASYIPTVQTALPRLLGAAAPPGASASENRRQCLKVLRLWLERKILPESILRRYMDDIGASNDDTISGFSLRRPSRAERAIDDPIREMEGMLVDEYGSNATFQLPGLLSSNAFEDDEEELSDSPCGEAVDASPLEMTQTSAELEACTVTPSDRRHCILEDVDGELEMEDVSAHQKEDRPSFTNDTLERTRNSWILIKLWNQVQIAPMDAPSNRGFPPLPPDSPLPPPPLPLSSPPPPPPSSPSPPPPPLPLPTQPPPPLPLPTQPPPSSPPPPPPPPPPPLPTQQPPPPAPPSCPPPAFIPQLPLPTQPSLLSQPMVPPQSSMQSSPQLVYQLPVYHEFRGTSNGNQIVQMGGTAHGGHIDVAVKSELFMQQSPSFQSGVRNSLESSGYNFSRQLEYGHNEMYLNAQSSQPSQQFPPGNTAFVQRPLPPSLPQASSSHFSFTKPSMQPHPQHSCPQYSLPSQHDGRRPFVADEQWRMPASDYNTDNQCGWIGGRNPPSSGPIFVQEDMNYLVPNPHEALMVKRCYFRPPVERPSSSNMGYPNASTNNLPAGPPNSGHGVSPILPCRPDMSAINSWRPARE